MEVSRRIKKKTKARKLCKISKFIHCLKSIENGEEFDSNHCNIYPQELEVCKENKVKHEARYLELDIEIRDRRFQIGLFSKKDLPLLIINSN